MFSELVDFKFEPQDFHFSDHDVKRDLPSYLEKAAWCANARLREHLLRVTKALEAQDRALEFYSGPAFHPLKPGGAAMVATESPAGRMAQLVRIQVEDILRGQ